MLFSFLYALLRALLRLVLPTRGLVAPSRSSYSSSITS